MSDLEIPENLDIEQLSEELRRDLGIDEPAPVEEPEEDWKTKYEEAERARGGILSELTQTRRESQAMRADLDAMRQAIQQLSTPPEPEDEDPFQRQERKLDQYSTAVQQRLAALEQRQQNELANARLSDFQQKTQAMEREFKSQVPDYDDALNHARRVASDWMISSGYKPEQVQTLLPQMEAGIAIQALQQGLNPAQVAYEKAKGMGYQPKVNTPNPPNITPLEPVNNLSLQGAPNRVSQPTNLTSILEADNFDKIAQNHDMWRKLNEKLGAV